MGALAAAAFGLTLGSFINVVIHRLPRGESLVRPGSRCVHCQRPIRWWENIPLLSFVVMRGRCRGCEGKISFRYPLVEISVGVLFVLAVEKYGWNGVVLGRDWPLLAAMVAIVFIDIDHRIIPDVLSLGGGAWALAWSNWVPGLGLQGAALGAGVGFGVFYLFAWSYLRATGRSGLGGGDIKFLAFVGAFLGLPGVFTTIMVSSISGSLFGIAWAVLSGKGNLMKASIPFGPFLVIGALAYYFWGDFLWLQFMRPM